MNNYSEEEYKIFSRLFILNEFSEVNLKKLSNIKKASRFIYLNKTGFNGLYRVNKNGQFNVPFGKYKNPNYADSNNILACSNLLQETTILNGDFEIIKKYIKKDDFVYFDMIFLCF